jgi:hypothetical protein
MQDTPARAYNFHVSLLANMLLPRQSGVSQRGMSPETVKAATDGDRRRNYIDATLSPDFAGALGVMVRSRMVWVVVWLCTAVMVMVLPVVVWRVSPGCRSPARVHWCRVWFQKGWCWVKAAKLRIEGWCQGPCVT